MIRFAQLLASGRVAIAGARVLAPEGVGSVPDLIARMVELAPPEARFALLRASAVCSPLHLLAAVQGAWQALAEGTAMARDLGGETARYLAAERQVGQALRKAGLEANTTEVALVLILSGKEDMEEAGPEARRQDLTGGTDGEEYVSTLLGGEAGVTEAMDGASEAGKVLTGLVGELGWERNDELLTGGGFDPVAFGLPLAVLDDAPGDLLERLVLARCALVPLLK